MAGGTARPEPQEGSILLPVILLLLLLATAATAMTLQARTSLREAATRRDRLALATTADAVVRATAFALAGAAAGKASPPFRLDGTAQACWLADGRRLALSVQDEGGLVDLNKGSADLIAEILRRASLSAPDANTLTKVITAHRADAQHPQSPDGQPPRQPSSRAPPPPGPEAQDFVLANEIGDLPGVDTARFTQLQPLFTTANRSAGIDPGLAAPAIRALVSSKDLNSPAFEAMTAPSAHTDFTITATVALPSGQRFARKALFRLDPDAGALGRFTAWDALLVFDPLPDEAEDGFCRRVAAALAL